MRCSRQVIVIAGTVLTLVNTLRLLTIQSQGGSEQNAADEIRASFQAATLNLASRSSSTSANSLPIIDILSIGSLNRPDYQDAQEITFGAHPSVRTFYRINERNDTSDVHCNANLTMPIVKRIMHFCGRRIKPFETLDRIKRLFTDEGYLMKKSNPVAWMCAQKRPQDALFALLQQYKKQQQQQNTTASVLLSSLPDYLFVIDDDTWVNMNAVVPFVAKQYPSIGAYAVTGCLARMRKVNFTFAYGGWGTMLSKPTLQAWLKPIRCNDNVATKQDAFSQQACARLRENGVGEQHLFVDGMSVADLMNAYVKDQEYADFVNWNPTGFCMHSDITIAYFLNYFALPSHSGDPKFRNVEVDRMQGYNDSHYYVGRQMPGQRAHRKQCLHKSDETCGPEAHLCHYVTPKHMLHLHSL